jgi:hypothetical protein
LTTRGPSTAASLAWHRRRSLRRTRRKSSGRPSVMRVASRTRASQRTATAFRSCTPPTERSFGSVMYDTR